MEVYSFINQKGGVGKTTATIVMGEILALLKKKTLILDLDPQVNISMLLNLESKIPGIYELLMEAEKKGIDNVNIGEYVVSGHIDNLFILPGSGAMERVKSGQHDREALKKLLSAGFFKDNFDYILIDNHPALSAISEMSVLASDKIVVPIFAEFLAIGGVTQIREWLRQNFKLDLEKVIVTKVPATKSGKEQLIKLYQIMGKHATKIGTYFIPQSAIIEKFREGYQSFIFKKPKDKVSYAYVQQTFELFNLIEGNDEIKRATGKFLSSIQEYKKEMNKEESIKRLREYHQKQKSKAKPAKEPEVKEAVHA